MRNASIFGFLELKQSPLNVLNVNQGVGMFRRHQKIINCQRCNRRFRRQLAEINYRKCWEEIYQLRNYCATTFKKDHYVYRTLEAFFGNRCMRCSKVNRIGGERRRLCIDHIVSLSNNGKNDITNFQLLCSPCNNWKRSKTVDFRINKKWIAQIIPLTTSSSNVILNSWTNKLTARRNP